MLLALDTSTRKMGVALYDGAQVISEMMWTSPFHHTVELAPAVELSLQRAGIGVGEVQAVGVALGPGSFTALRTGLAFVKGLALNGIPVLGVPTLDVLAACQPDADTPLAAVVEAGRKRFGVGWYVSPNGRWVPDREPELLSAEGLGAKITHRTLVSGELDAGAREILGRNPHVRLAPPAGCVRRPAVLAELAWLRWQSGGWDDPAGLVPLYLSEAG